MMMTSFFMALTSLELAIARPAGSPEKSIEDRLSQIIRSRGYCAEGVMISDVILAVQRAPLDTDLMDIHNDPPVGAIRFRIVGKNGQVEARARVSCREKIAVVSSDIKPGDSFDSTKIRFERREVSPYVKSGYFRSLRDLENMRARTYVRSGAILARMNVEEERWVISGEPVSIRHETGMLLISSPGRALESGRSGDWVRVQNVSSRRLVTARVTGRGIVHTRGSGD
jgi:flagella basal body P-ring formation protein FlgA